MGAEQFEQHGTGATMGIAFSAAVEAAAWEHGHGGYSGTLAEKSDFVGLRPADPSPERADAIREALASGYDDSDAAVVRLQLLIPGADDATLRRAIEAYDDKWGPAVGIDCGGDTYLFCGWASS